MSKINTVNPRVTYPGAKEAAIEFCTWLIEMLYTIPDEEPLGTERVIDHIMKQTWHEGVKLLIMFYVAHWVKVVFYLKDRGMKKEEVIRQMEENIAEDFT